MQITIYTDGACDIHAANKPGGWAAILRATDVNGTLIKETVISGGAQGTTNNQMELTAVIESLKVLKRASSLTIVTDSRYVINIASHKNRVVKNQSLWQEYFGIAEQYQINWKYVEGHAGNTLNERCDRLAVKEKKKRAQPSAQSSDEPVMLREGTTGIYLSTQYAGKDMATSWVSVIVNGGEIRELSGHLANTSELEGTLIGAFRSLESLPPGQDVMLFTAQEYLSKGMNQWLAGWIAKGWKTRGGEPVKYRGHWERLRQLSIGRQVGFRFVKSRADDPHFQRGKELTADILKRA